MVACSQLKYLSYTLTFAPTTFWDTTSSITMKKEEEKSHTSTK